LSEIEGIGPTLEKRLLETFKGLQGVKSASLDQLKNVKGLSEKVAVVLHSQLKADQ
jgi:excinuclease ABC subunit C